MDGGELMRKPSWLRSPGLGDESSARTRALLDGLGLHSVCSEAACPNLGRCFGSGTATFLIMGRICTRNCSYCAVEKALGRPVPPPGEDEPQRLGEAVARLGLGHAVITSVTRDDLRDGGAACFASATRAVRESRPGCTVELLTPDFAGRVESLERIAAEPPEIFSHNVETVERLFPLVRPQASFRTSLGVLSSYTRLKPGAPVKSGLMLGLGETREEILASFEDLLASGVRILTLGQYLRPGRSCTPVARYLDPGEFEELKEIALGAGFAAVASGPLVRSSFDAARLFEEFCARDEVGGEGPG